MSVEILLMAIIAGITLLGYMVAINDHGPTRLGLSYLMATIMLAGTVWIIVQHVNTGQDHKKVEELKRLGLEKQKTEEALRSKEQALEENRQRLNLSTRLTAITTNGSGIASAMRSVELQDRSLDYDGLVGRAVAYGKKATALKEEYEKISTDDDYFDESIKAIAEAIELTNEAAYYFRSFYHSEDSEQEELRERIMRQKSRKAYTMFQKAASLLAASADK